jgi:uncharacterized protein (DUF3820 family)
MRAIVSTETVIRVRERLGIRKKRLLALASEKLPFAAERGVVLDYETGLVWKFKGRELVDVIPEKTLLEEAKL